MRPKHLCGFEWWHPSWLQKFANSKSFMIVYGLVGTTQGMAFLYFIATLTTIEKRFKIPSRTTGIILSGNELSQIMLSLILSYIGGQRNRPKWISWGMVFCSISCFILALPHFIYGPGDDALHLTKEYKDEYKNISSTLNSTISHTVKGSTKLCLGVVETEICDELFNIVPLVLLFLSQFVLGIGTTLYYSLGQSYLDDNTKKTNTPMMLACAMSLRMFGPVAGYLLGYLSLNLYIDPTKTPLIDNKDPRWLGAWWIGWVFLGLAMMLFSLLIRMFPSQMQKKKTKQLEVINDENAPLRTKDCEIIDKAQEIVKTDDLPKLRDFPTALMRLLKNKILIFNIISTIFYILGSTGYITFLSKYIEVQFNKSPADATILTGPITLAGMESGFLLSGIFITRYKPRPSKLFFWNVIVGSCYIVGQVIYIFLACDNPNTMNFSVNLTSTCNMNCSCDGVTYSPVCFVLTGITYFSPCHAACNKWDNSKKIYSNCACASKQNSWNNSAILLTQTNAATTQRTTDVITEKNSLKTTSTTISDSTTTLPNTFWTTISSVTEYSQEYVNLDDDKNDNNFAQYDDEDEENQTLYETVRRRRSIKENSIMTPGACLAGCAKAFYLFTFIMFAINWLGSTGRIGNVLLNFRAVADSDKSFSQGLALWMISLFAFTPGPIIYGYIIDSTCLVWNYKCGNRGNCQLYDPDKFRYYVNITAVSLTFIGVFFDLLVWHYGKNIRLYGESDGKKDGPNVTDTQSEQQCISPLMSKES